MPDGGRHHHRSDAEHRSRDVHRATYKKPRDVEGRASAGDRRTREDRNRQATGPSHREEPAYIDHHQEGASRPPRETSVSRSDAEYYVQEHRKASYDLRHALTARGICQLMQLFVNLLIVICAGVPYSNNGGYRDLASLGGIYYYYFGGANAFTGADAEKVKNLDQLFHQLKRPPYVFAMAFAGVLMIYACIMFALGVFRVPHGRPVVLLVEALLSFLVGLSYIPALAFYFIKIQETYNSRICKDREQMYKSKGHEGFSCQFNGADIAGGLFGVLGVFVFIFGAVLVVRAYRSVRELNKQRTNENNDFQTCFSLPHLRKT
ncbi:MARVEL domain-containing protein 3 isoform X2 [Kryptolebias marmoratus]|uniref:MARVEL domain containing 3 n=2 Tax=Kryptolebias marmoratus TaxID=37003 RepID=A0A3Q2ZZE4_KRYMA|nr:MARVEL domain-containing protein 3 isoform X2 [Kryptolebias marmoratus]XP_017260172.1 MARVEL domain-containing protein 3 isoform X2 [Kryptolebias marmoratus]